MATVPHKAPWKRCPARSVRKKGVMRHQGQERGASVRSGDARVHWVSPPAATVTDHGGPAQMKAQREESRLGMSQAHMGEGARAELAFLLNDY